jgi:hypoxanthine phosphoribosyltransferase
MIIFLDSRNGAFRLARRLVAGPEKIREARDRLAAGINRDYKGRRPVLVGVLKGSFMFIADLVRLLEIPVQVDFITAGSYGSATCTSGTVRIKNDIGTDISGRDVIIVDDILDSGLTLSCIRSHLESKGPSSVKTCVLLDKPSRRAVECPAEYVGMKVPNVFLVGYGLDYAEDYRYLDGLFELVQKRAE